MTHFVPECVYVRATCIISFAGLGFLYAYIRYIVCTVRRVNVPYVFSAIAAYSIRMWAYGRFPHLKPPVDYYNGGRKHYFVHLILNVKHLQLWQCDQLKGNMMRDGHWLLKSYST